LAAVLLCVTLCVLLLSGCDTQSDEPEDDPVGIPIEASFTDENLNGQSFTFTLTLSPDIDDLTGDNITVVDGNGVPIMTSIERLDSGYTIRLSNVFYLSAGSAVLTVTVQKNGYIFDPASWSTGTLDNDA
jgi:hypothetical protein